MRLSGNHIIDVQEALEWLEVDQKESVPYAKQTPVKKCGCGKYEHCQSCSEERI